MKKIFTFILTVLCAVTLFAQAPEKFTYQAMVQNASNALVINAQVGVRVNILQGSATGDAVHSESHVTTSNANGLVTVSIGGGSVLHGSFAGIAWAKEANKPAYDYSEIANTLTIPTVPSNMSAFSNDAGYLTSYTENQILSISNDTLFPHRRQFREIAVLQGKFSVSDSKQVQFSQGNLQY